MVEKEFEKAYNYSCKLLKFRDRSVKEIIERLQKKKFDEKIVNAVVEKLKQQRYLDDKEFVKKYFDKQILKGKSVNLIIQEVVNKYMIEREEIVKSVDLDRYKQIQIHTVVNVIKKKYKPYEKNKIYNFLVSKGYQNDEIEVVLDILKKENWLKLEETV